MGAMRPFLVLRAGFLSAFFVYQIGIYRSVGAAPKTAMCSFLVSAQETNQRKRPGEALSAKSFDAADFNQIVPRL